MPEESHEHVELHLAGRGKRQHFTAGNLTCRCTSDLVEELTSVYESHDWVYDALAGSKDIEILRGRQPVLAGRIGGRDAIVKRFHHGGLATNLLKDRFLSPARFENHIRFSQHLARHGVPTPEVLFVSWRRIFGTARGEIGFARVDGIDADRWFFRDGSVPADWREQAARVGEAVASLHRARFHHRDMNLMNFYFSRQGDVLVLDLDKGEIEPSMSERMVQATLDRLERSIRKQGRGRDPDYVDGIVDEVRRGWAEAHA